MQIDCKMKVPILQKILSFMKPINIVDILK